MYYRSVELCYVKTSWSSPKSIFGVTSSVWRKCLWKFSQSIFLLCHSESNKTITKETLFRRSIVVVRKNSQGSKKRIWKGQKKEEKKSWKGHRRQRKHSGEAIHQSKCNCLLARKEECHPHRHWHTIIKNQGHIQQFHHHLLGHKGCLHWLNVGGEYCWAEMTIRSLWPLTSADLPLMLRYYVNYLRNSSVLLSATRHVHWSKQNQINAEHQLPTTLVCYYYHFGCWQIDIMFYNLPWSFPTDNSL